MSYSIGASLFVDGGSTVLSAESLSLLVDGDKATNYVEVSVGETLFILCELYNRYSLSSIKFYFLNGDISVFVSEVTDVWVPLPTVDTSYGVEVVDFLGIHPKWIRIEVVPSLDPSFVYELEIYSLSNLLFGESGEFTSYALDSSSVFIQPVPLYNDTNSVVDVNVFIGDSGSVVSDSFVMVGLDAGGPFYSKRELGVSIPSFCSWDSGIHQGTETTISGHLTISGILEEGSYYSPVLFTDGFSNVRFYWEDNSLGFVSSAQNSNVPSFGLRCSHISPSGAWSPGQVALEGDLLWSTSSGSLNFSSITKNVVMSLPDKSYFQFFVTLSGTEKPYIYSAGIEAPLTVSGIYPRGNKKIYLTSSSGVINNEQIGLLCWYMG